MWGKLNQMVSGDQQKIDNLEAQLQEEQERNKAINDQFKKVLKEKEKEIQKLKSSAGSDVTSGAANGAVDDREEMKEELTKLQRKIEEYQMLNTQKDENIQVLMQQANEADELRFKVEAQERVNSEKLMFELAGRIDAHEKISNKLEEVTSVLQQRDTALADLADEIAAKDQMLSSKEDAIKKLKSITPNAPVDDEMLVALERSAAEKDMQIGQLKSTIALLEQENNTLSSAEDTKTHQEPSKEFRELEEAFNSEKNGKLELEQKNKEVCNLNEELQSKIANLQALLDASELKFEEQSHELKELKDSFALSIDENSLLEQKNQELDSMNEDLKSKIINLEAMLDTSHSEVEEKSKELHELKDSLNSMGNDNSLFEQKNQELDILNKDLQSNISNLESMLESSRLDAGTLKKENENVVSELNSIKEKLQTSHDNKDSLTKKMSERDDNEQVLCAEITQLQSDNDRLNKTILELEATIVQLDGDINASQGNINKHKIHTDELQESLLNANKENVEIKKKISEIDDILKSYAEITDSRRKSKECNSEGTLLDVNQTTPARNLLCDLLKVLEDERVELEQSLKNAVKEKDEFIEKNKVLERLLVGEREKFDTVLEKSLKLQEELAEKGQENNQLSSKVEEEITSLNELLSCTEEQYKLLSGNELEMTGNIDALANDLAKKEEEISKLQKYIQKLGNMVEEVDVVTQKDVSNFQARIIELEKEKTELVKEKDDKVAECSNLEQQLKKECAVTADLESQLEMTKNKITSLENTLKEQNDSHASLSNAQEEKCKELETELQQWKVEIKHLQHTIEEGETKTHVTNESLQKTEVSLLTLEEDMKKLQKEYVTLQQHECNLQLQLAQKEEELDTLNSNYMSKEEEVKMLSCKIQSLDQEIKLGKENESDLHTKVMTLEEGTKDLLQKSDYFLALSNEHVAKYDELSKSNRQLSTELKVRDEKLENLVLTIAQKEEELQTLNGDLKSKTDIYESLDVDLKDLEEKYYSLESLNTRLQADLSAKDENLQTLRDSIKSLSSEIEVLGHEREARKDNEQSLNLTISKYMEEMDAIASTLKTTEDLVKTKADEICDLQKERDLLQTTHNEKESQLKIASTSIDQQNILIKQLQDELTKVERNYQNDLFETKLNYDNLQKQYETLQGSDADIQKHLNAKDEEMSQLLVERQSMILKHNDELSALQADISTKEETLYDKMEEMDRTFRENLSGKDAEIERLNILTTDLHSSILQTKTETTNTIEGLTEKESQLIDQMKVLDKSLHQKNEELTMAINAKENLDCEIKELKNTLASKEERIKDEEREVANLKEVISDLEFSFEQSKINSSKCIAEFSEKELQLVEKTNVLEQALQHKEEEITETVKCKENYESLLNKSSCENDELRSALSCKDKECKASDIEIAKLRDIISNSEVLFEQSKVESNNSVELASQLTEKVKSLEQSVSQKQEELLMMAQVKENFDIMLCDSNSEIEELKGRLTSYQENLNDRDVEIEKLNTTLLNLQTSHDESKTKAGNAIDVLSKKEEQLLHQIKSLEQSMQDKNEELSRIIEAKEDLGISLEQCNFEIEQLKNNIISKVDEIKALAHDLNTFKGKEDDWKDIVNEKDRIIATGETEVLSLKSEIGKLQEDLQKVLEEKVNINTALVQKESELAEACKNLEVLASSKESSIGDLSATLREKEQQIVNLQTQLEGADMDRTLQMEKFMSEKKEIGANAEVSINEKETKIMELELLLNSRNDTIFDLEGQLEEHISQKRESTAHGVEYVVEEPINTMEVQHELYATSDVPQSEVLSAIGHIGGESELIVASKDYQILNEENDKNKEFIKVLVDEIETLKDDCKSKDILINDLRNDISNTNKEGFVPSPSLFESSSLNESSEDNATGALVTTSAPDLEWDPSGYMNKHLLDDSVDEPLCSSVDVMFSEAPIITSETEAVMSTEADELCGSLPDSAIVELEEKMNAQLMAKEEENKKLAAEVEKLQLTLNKFRKKSALLKKAQIELAKEIEAMQTVTNEKESEIAKLRGDLNELQDKLELSTADKNDTDEKVINMQKLVGVALNDEQWDMEDFDGIRDRLLKTRECENQVLTMQDELSELQNSYDSVTAEVKNVSLDCQRLVEQKLEKVEEIETLMHANQRLEAVKKNQMEAYLKSIGDIVSSVMGRKDSDIDWMVVDGNDDEVFKQNLRFAEDKLQNEIKNMIQSLKNENVMYRDMCEEEKTKALRELEVAIKKEGSQEINLLKNEVDVIIERQVAAEKLREEERVLKEQALVELEHMREQLGKSLLDVQQARKESQECESKLLGEIERELIDVKERLQASNAANDQMEAVMKCEALLKEQIMKENDILKSEMDVLQKDQLQQSSLLNEVEEVKKHKDLVIKKLKLKLKKEITEKEKLNESLSESMNISSTVPEKESVIVDLQNELTKRSCEQEELIKEKMKEISEQDDLIKALKDELSWLKDSITPLMAKAEKSDKIQKENQHLKQCIESKDDELTHLKENALLKENEVMYLIDQEKRMQEEYLAQKEKLRLKDEEREITMKAMKDEMKWLETQVDDLSPKAEQLTHVCEEINTLKESISKEVLHQKDLEKQIHILEMKAMEKDNLYTNLQDHCTILENQLDDLMSNKDEVDELNTSFKEMEELYSTKREELAQVNESLSTREVQLEDLRKDLVNQTNVNEELQVLLQSKDVETQQASSLLDRERKVIDEKDELLAQLRNEISKEQENVSSLHDQISEMNESLEKKTRDSEDSRRRADELEQLNCKEQEKVHLLHDQINEMNELLDEKTREWEDSKRRADELEQINNELKETEQLYVSQQSQVEQLIDEVTSLKERTIEYDDIVGKLENLKQRNLELEEIERVHLHLKTEFERIHLILDEKDEKLLQNEEVIKEQASRLDMEQKRSFEVDNNLKSVLAQYDEKSADIDALEEGIIHGQHDLFDNDKGVVYDRIKRIIEEKTTSLSAASLSLENKEKESAELMAVNTNLVQRMKTMQDDYENSICMLKESIAEKERLYNNSLTQVKIVKELMEMEDMDTTANSPEISECMQVAEVANVVESEPSGWDDAGSGWDDAASGWDDASSGWDDVYIESKEVNQTDIEINKLKEEEVANLGKDGSEEKAAVVEQKSTLDNVVSERGCLEEGQNETKEKYEHVQKIDFPIEEVNCLKNEVAELSKECDEKEAALVELKTALEKLASERDSLEKEREETKEKYKHIENIDFPVEEVCGLRDEVVKLSKECSEKEMALVELKSALDKVVSERDCLEKEQKETKEKYKHIENIDFPLEKVCTLKDELDELSRECGEKEAALVELKCALDKLDSEKDCLEKEREETKEKYKHIENIDFPLEEVGSLKDSVEKLKEEKSLKEVTIAKLKLKLKQTIKGRDQLKENLQSELDRISQEKDLIFNEFSEKLQQQNMEIDDLKNSSAMLSETVEAISTELVQKKEELKTLQGSLSLKEKAIEDESTSYSELKIKYDEIVAEKNELCALKAENDDTAKKLDVESTEKDQMIFDLNIELNKIKSDLEDFNDIRSTLEEAMKIKDESIENLRRKMETLQQEYVKLNFEHQASMSKHEDHDDTVTALQKKAQAYQEEKENVSIMASKYKAELEAVEILFGFSNQDGSFIEQVSSWKLGTVNKLKESERQVHHQEMENNYIRNQLLNIERLCDIPKGDSIPVIERLGNVQNFIQNCQGDLRIADQPNLADNKEEERPLRTPDNESNDNVTYQLLENKIKIFTALAEELQKKVGALCGEKGDNSTSSIPSEDDINVLPGIIDEISTIKHQLEKDISYSQSEWNHLQSENQNLKRQIALLTSSPELSGPTGESSPRSIDTEKTKAFLEMQNSFEVAMRQKNDVVNSLRNRISELRDQLLTLTSQQTQLSVQQSNERTYVCKSCENLSLINEAKGGSGVNETPPTVDTGAKDPLAIVLGDMLDDTELEEPVISERVVHEQPIKIDNEDKEEKIDSICNQLLDIERLCDIPKGDNISVTERLGNIHNFIQNCQDELKIANQPTLLDNKEEERPLRTHDNESNENVTYQLLENKIKIFTALAEELQKKVGALCGEKSDNNISSIPSEDDINVLPGIVDEISTIKHQLEKDISYSQSEWIHLQAENQNLKRQIDLLTSSPELAGPTDESSLRSTDTEKTKAFLEMQNSFEVAMRQKDDVVNSLRKRISELRDQLLTLTSQQTQLSVQQSNERTYVCKSCENLSLINETKTVSGINDITETVSSDIIDHTELEESENERNRTVDVSQEQPCDDSNITEDNEVVEEDYIMVAEQSLYLSAVEDVLETSDQDDILRVGETAREKEERLELENQLLREKEERSDLENQLQSTTLLLENKDKCLNETLEELKEKANECSDLIEENNDLKEEIVDLKEALQENNGELPRLNFGRQIQSLNTLKEGYERELERSVEKITLLQDAKVSLESELREKEYIISKKQEEVAQLNGELQEMSARIQDAHSTVSETNLMKEDLSRKCGTTEDELTRLELENTNLRKQIDVLSSSTSDDQDVISKKNEAFLELRGSFEDVVSQKDSVIDSMRENISKYRDELLTGPERYQEQMKQYESLSVEKDEMISELNKKVTELSTDNTWLKGELDRVIKEKKHVDGNFESISSGLRTDLELAFKEKKKHGDDLHIYCLKLERDMKALQDELSNNVAKLKEQENLGNEKDIVIKTLQEQLEGSAESMGYQVLQQRVNDKNENVARLSSENESLLETLTNLSELYDSSKIELDLMRNEKNQLKLETSGHIQDIMLKNEEDIQFLTTSFEKSLRERDAELSEARSTMTDKEEERTKLESENSLLKSKLKDMEEVYTNKINDLVAQLDVIVAEREKGIIDNDLSTTLEKDYNNLLSAKEEKINHISMQYNESQMKCNELNEVITEKNDKIKSLKSEITALETSNKSAEADVIKQTIITKGKQLKDLRDEFESVFEEKNNIIDTIREALKASRDEVIQLQQEVRNANENNRILEQNFAEIDFEKLQIETKLSRVLEKQEDTNSLLEKEGAKQREMEEVLNENAKLKVAAENCNCNTLTSENELLTTQLNDLQHTLEEMKIDDLQSKSAELENELSTVQSILTDINNTMEKVPDLGHIDGLVHNLPKKVEQLVSNMTSSKKYCDELSKKMHEVMEQSSVSDIEERDEAMKSLEDRIKSLEGELIKAVGEKEDIHRIVRDEYDDILQNLRGDFDECRERYKALQEENFSLQNQIDVFTNVNGKRIELEKAQSRAQSRAGSPAGSPVTPTTERMENLAQEKSQVDQKEVSALKSNVNKLKVLCKRYKAEVQTLKDELDRKTKETEKANAELASAADAAAETINSEKNRYQQEIRDLREEINILVVEKDGIIDSFKNRNENDIVQMKEMYQISLNKLSQDIQAKDNLIEKYESELEQLKADKLSPSAEKSKEVEVESELANMDTSELLKRISTMKKQMTILKEEKMSCLKQMRSHREEITEFVQQRDSMVTLWQSKLEEKEKNECRLKSEIEELVKSIQTTGKTEKSNITDQEFHTQLKEKENELIEKEKILQDSKHHKQVAESRLLDVVVALQDLGVIEKVQAKLLERESSLKNLQNVSIPMDDIAELKKSLEEKDAVIAENEKRISDLEEKLRLWRGPHLNEDQMIDGSLHESSRVSEIIDWPDSDQLSLGSDLGSMSSRPSAVPSTPTMERN